MPVEPTVIMCRAGLAERHDDLAKEIWRAMLSAAPQLFVKTEQVEISHDIEYQAHKAVLAACMSIEGCYHSCDPKLTLKKLINWYVQEATDVANDVSETVKIQADNYVRITCTPPHELSDELTNLIRQAANALDDLTPCETPETSAEREIAQDLRLAIEARLKC